MKTPTQNPYEITGATVFRQKLRDLVALLEKNSASCVIAPDDLAALRHGEDELIAHVSRSEEALRSAHDAEVAMEAARLRATRAIGEYRIARLDIAVRMERILARLPETPERAVHRATLRELLAGSKPAQSDSLVLPVPEKVRTAPVAMRTNTIELFWSVPVMGDCRFEIEAARSEPTIKPKQGKTIAAPLRFEALGTVSQTHFDHRIGGKGEATPVAGTVIYYRVRSLGNIGEISEWSSTVCATIPHSPKTAPLFPFAPQTIMAIFHR